MGDPYGWLAPSLTTIRRANWYRTVKPLTGRSGPVITLDGRSLINFGSNDYLGLASDNRVIQAAIAATETYGTGSTGSRLITGHRPLHRELEQAIAALKQTEDAIVFSSGYLANVGTITAIVGKRDLILADQYNHSSLKAGAALSGATVIEYPHGQTAALQTLLEHQRSRHRRCLILTDSVFSMDGDLCPLPEILAIAHTYDSMVLVDEAHGTGVLGATGAGCVEHFGCTGQPLIQMGTLSKALGSLGGYVAGSTALIDFLRNRAATWIYTTGLSPADAGAALAALRLVQAEPEHRQRLWQWVHWLQPRLTDLSPQYTVLPTASPILCVQVPSPAIALQLGQTLQDGGIFAPAIRPPTVPTSRLRLTLMATHTLDHLQLLVTALQQLTRSLPS